MPNGNVPAFVQEVTLRSNRIRELLETDGPLQRLFDRFDRFSRVLLGSDLEVQAKIPELREQWRQCRLTDLMDLRNQAENVRFLNQPLAAGANGNPVTAWVGELDALLPEVQAALDGPNLGALRQHSERFVEALSGARIDHRGMLRLEVRELCELTIRVSQQIGPPGGGGGP